MKTEKFVRKPFYVEAVRVTAENIHEVAEWCKGKVVDTDLDTHFVQVNVKHPLNERQTQAFVGDWVLFANKGYKVYQDTPFRNSFNRHQEHDRSSVTGQFVSHETADANPKETVHES